MAIDSGGGTSDYIFTCVHNVLFPCARDGNYLGVEALIARSSGSRKWAGSRRRRLRSRRLRARHHRPRSPTDRAVPRSLTLPKTAFRMQATRFRPSPRPAHGFPQDHETYCYCSALFRFSRFHLWERAIRSCFCLFRPFFFFSPWKKDLCVVPMHDS